MVYNSLSGIPLEGSGRVQGLPSEAGSLEAEVGHVRGSREGVVDVGILEVVFGRGLGQQSGVAGILEAGSGNGRAPR